MEQHPMDHFGVRRCHFKVEDLVVALRSRRHAHSSHDEDLDPLPPPLMPVFT